ncbi:MAG: beta galactosidase jelly roll domain-containing protein, partial [Muribaculaceae bacterium]|nr:beta galactosidase jelly roll domain-containing protein [Muribaculaceae bacterium]
MMAAGGCVNVAAQWKPAGDRILTRWASQIDPADVLPEYPRPMMERKEWKNLNGLWEYAVLPAGRNVPDAYDGEILVPFAVESALSGVGKTVGKDNELWYRRSFDVPAAWKGQRVLLHFGAVDWKASVWVNGVKAGEHSGAYEPFDFDVTELLRKGDNELVVRVWDPTDKGPQPRGKQVSEPGGIWYTPVSGIWQTVWLEPVPQQSIAALRVTPDIDNGKLTVGATLRGDAGRGRVEVAVFDGGVQVASASAVNGAPVEIVMPDGFKLWSPDSPNLYDMEVRLYDGKKLVDKVKSYTAMRKFSTNRDEAGYLRLQLNNKDLFQFGPLDQGWWPDGLYTAPTDEALVYDIQKTKDLGFNMIRKHLKVEPARWYTHCDRIGMIVWQDMPSGEPNKGDWQYNQYYYGPAQVRTPESAAIYYKELKGMMDCLYSYPCVGMWIPFNEAMGQFNSVDVTDWVKKYDPSRPVNSASGGNYYPSGDVLDLHSYPEPIMFLFDRERANVIGEFGGIGIALKGHLWDKERNWGYGDLQSGEAATRQYVEYATKLSRLAQHGLCGAVYTQTTDVEIEINGLMTYDREIVKFDEGALNRVNSAACRSLDGRGAGAINVLCLGNSITRHERKDDIEWFSEWGMAASREENDYCHRLEAMIAKDRPGSKVTPRNIAY